MYGAQTVTGYGRTLGDSTLGEVSAAQRVGHIADGMNELDRLTQTLADEIGALAQRIEPALRPDPPQGPGNKPDSVRPVMSNLAGGLHDFNARIHAQIQRVRELAARADL